MKEKEILKKLIKTKEDSFYIIKGKKVSIKDNPSLVLKVLNKEYKKERSKIKLNQR